MARYSKTAEKLLPHLLQELSQVQPVIIAQAGDGGSLAVHALDGEYHTGTLDESQAPWAVTAAVFGAHEADPDAHHNQATVVAPVVISGQQISLSYAAPLTVVAGALDVALGDGVEEAGGSLRAKVPTNSGIARDGSGLYLSPSTVAVATTNAVSGSGHTHAITTTTTGTPATIVALDANGYTQAARWVATDRVRAPLLDTASGNQTLQPAGDVILDPTGNDVLPATNYDINLGALAKKYLTLHAAELWVETLVAQNTIATIGGRILVGPTTTLTRDLATGDTTIYVKHNQMVSGDRSYLEADGKVEFLAITSGPTNTGSDYSYTVTRNLDSSGANQWYAGDAVFNTGQAGNGFIDLYSIRGVKSAGQAGPTIVGNVRNSSTFNDWSEAWAIGNLNGLYGYGTNLMGVGLGKYASGQPNVVIDPTNGVRLRQYNTDMIVLDPAGNSYFAGVMTIGTGGEIRQGTGTLGSNYTGLRIWRDTNVGRIAGYNNNVLQWYCGTDGKIYAGTGLIWLDSVGVNLTPYTSHDDDATTIQWDHPSHLPAKLWAKMDTAANTCGMVVEIPASGINLTQALVIKASVPSGFASIYQVWHAGNDGAGSGLDADKLDTYEATAFGRLAASQTWTANQQINASLGIGITPSQLLHIYGSSPKLMLQSSAANQAPEMYFYDDASLKGRLLYAGGNSAGAKYFGFIANADYLGFFSDTHRFWNYAASVRYADMSSTAVWLSARGTSSDLYVDASGYVLINTSSNTYSARLNVSGNIHGDAAITAENFFQLKQRSGSPGSATGFGRIYYDSGDDKLKYITSGGTVRTLSYT